MSVSVEQPGKEVLRGARGMLSNLGQKKNSCVQVSLPTLILGPTLEMLKIF